MRVAIAILIFAVIAAIIIWLKWFTVEDANSMYRFPKKQPEKEPENNPPSAH